MKKFYVQPNVVAVRIETEAILAGSGDGTEETTIGYDTTSESNDGQIEKAVWDE